MNFKTTVLIVGLAVAASSATLSTAQSTAPAKQSGATTASAASDMAQGEIQKVDKDTGRLTIKHGEIKNLDMPGMTMVFATKDKTMVDKVKTGDKIRFKAVNENGKFIVTEIQTDK